METKIRNANFSDIPSLLDFARHVGRFICADELRTWLQVDSEALFVAEEIPEGKLIGSCCATRLTPDLGFMGLYVVLREYRGKGIGLKLWKAAKEHLGDRNIGVRGDPVNFKKYTEKEGFCHVEDYVITYYECFSDYLPTNIVSSSDIEVATYFEGNLIDCKKKSNNKDNLTDKHETHNEACSDDSKSTSIESNIPKNADGAAAEKSFAEDPLNTGKLCSLKDAIESLPSSVALDGISIETEDGQTSFANQTNPNIGIRITRNEFSFNSMNPDRMKNLKTEDILSKVVAYDKFLHKRDRSFVVQQTFSWSTCRSKVALVEGKVVGYACLRRVVTEHWIISPFYADTEDVAEVLLFELLQGFDFSQAPKGIQIRFPDKNIACKKLVEKFGFREHPIRIMTGFTKWCANVNTSKVYSFHSTVFCSD